MCFFIEFEPLCQKLRAFLLNFGSFYLIFPVHQIWSCKVTQDSNFEKSLFGPNSAFNIRESHKISSRKTLCFRTYQQNFELRSYGYLNLILSSLPLSPDLTNRQVGQKLNEISVHGQFFKLLFFMVLRFQSVAFRSHY